MIDQLLRKGLVILCAFSIFCTTFASSINPPCQPSASAKMIDILLGRPVMLGITITGVALFLATLPFSYARHQVHESADSFIIAPAQATFCRCLGCEVNLATPIHPFYSCYLPS